MSNFTDIRAKIQEKYPAADLRPYFAFLAALPARAWKQGKGLHRHHIAPRELFPELDEGMSGSNIFVLTFGDHVRAHKILGIALPDASWPPPAFISYPGSPEHRAAHRTPEARARHAAANRKSHRTPKARAKAAAANRKSHRTPKARANQSAASRKMWSDPKVRARHAAANRKHYRDPKNLARHAAVMRKWWAARKQVAKGSPLAIWQRERD